jgi:hypothetical protein
MTEKREAEEIFACPLCGQPDMDAVGFKYHLEMGYCDVYNNTMTVEEERVQRLKAGKEGNQ